MNSDFANLGVTPPILKALAEMGFETPTEVQSQTIPHILSREDVIVKSKTGSGKTAVFGISMLQLIDARVPGPQGLILTPTRELAVQIDSDLKNIARYLPHKLTPVYGQHDMQMEIQALNRGVSIVTGTPGRVYDHIQHGHLKTKHLRFLVLDEADRMLDMGFLDEVRRIIKTIPKDRMTLLFSATIPAEIRKICLEYMRRPVTIEVESPTMTVETTKQFYYRVAENEKNLQLHRLLLLERPESCMIFCNRRITVDRVQNFLTRKGYASQALHGDIPQVKRLKTLQRFKQGEFSLLVATDVAARGIHIDDLSLVINYDVPLEKDGYVHRIGRTGRAGNGGRALTLVTSEDIMSLYEIEEHIGTMIQEAELPTEAVLHEQRNLIEAWTLKNAPPKPVARDGSGSNLVKMPSKRAVSKPAAQRTHSGSGSNSGNRSSSGSHPYSGSQPRPGSCSVSGNRPHSGSRSNSGNRPYAGNRPHQRQAETASATVKPLDTQTAAESMKEKPAPSLAQPVRPQPTKAEVLPAQFNPEKIKAQTEAPAASPNKKPILQRIIQKIFGK